MTADDLRRSPLAGVSGAFPAAGGAVSLRELPFPAQFSFRFRDAPLLSAPGSGPGGPGSDPGPVPGPGRFTRIGERLDALRLGPDEWLVVGPDGAQGAIRDLLEPVLDPEYGSLVDVSANRTVLELAGPAARSVLEKGCSIDLHPRVFPPGSCVQTLLSKVQVILRRTIVAPGPAYQLFVRPSFADYLARWLLDAMAEYTG
ncbi:sarcosine oxidase subunit gamma [Streptacidiphilus rugosus]|uniref:sarcosine oxidase subunit gamma n=1 Tax=Streptacidiphilus rugosus TaxID=405783 RepID=UPI00056D2269|nr:sarcosine oxidase subunit gamma family protein [Streptacidiphilus rugosus]